MRRNRARISAPYFAGLFFLISISPYASAQSTVGTQACQGSTVDAQGEDVARKSRAFLAELQAAESKGDKARVATMVSYPLLVNHGSSRMRIRTKAQFLSQYDAIFTKHIHQAIAQQTAKCLFGNYQGAMIGDGEVWFSEQPGGAWKIISVNLDSGKQ
jgi:hypothetical protein